MWLGWQPKLEKTKVFNIYFTENDNDLLTFIKFSIKLREFLNFLRFLKVFCFLLYFLHFIIKFLLRFPRIVKKSKNNPKSIEKS